MKMYLEDHSDTIMEQIYRKFFIFTLINFSLSLLSKPVLKPLKYTDVEYRKSKSCLAY